MDRGVHIFGPMRELADMPEYALFAQLQGSSASIYTFDRNYQDLVRRIEFLANDPRAQPLFWLRNRDRLNLAMQDIIRLTHNYVAAASSLIDHTRRLHKKLYAEANAFPEYHPRVESEFAHDPLSQFVKCLRGYCLHYRAPNLSLTTARKQGDQKPTRTFCLLRSDLESFDGWSAPARKYLATAVEEVSILQFCTEYRDKVMAFYRWFQTRQEEIHAEDLRRFRDKERQLLTLMLASSMDASLAASRQGLPHRKDDVFASVFTSREFDDLDCIPRDSPNHALRAIELLEQRFFPISAETKQAIVRLYELPDIVNELPDESEAG